MGHLISEEEKPEPTELYGKSKWEEEKILQNMSGGCDVAIFRSPTIIDEELYKVNNCDQDASELEYEES